MLEQVASQQVTASRDGYAGYNVTARYYDMEHGQVTGSEWEFYLELADRQAGPILELGCGTGRVALPLARTGHCVTALDLSAPMLAEFLTKLGQESAEVQERITLQHGSMADFRFDQRFSLITVPFRAFQHLMSVEQQRCCLGLVREHLAQGGVFALDIFLPKLEVIAHRMQHSDMWLAYKSVDLPTGNKLRHSYRVLHKPVSQTMQLEFRFEEFDPQLRLIGTELEEAEMRWMYRFEAEHLLELCGLEIVEAYGGYDKRPLDEGAVELLYVLKRAD